MGTHEGDAADVRYLKNGAAKAIRTLRADRPDAEVPDRQSNCNQKAEEGKPEQRVYENPAPQWFP